MKVISSKRIKYRSHTKTILTIIGIIATLGVAVSLETAIIFTDTAFAAAYASQGGDLDTSDQSQASANRVLATIIIVKTGNLGPQDKGDFNAEVTGNDPSPTPVNLGGDVETRTITIRPGSYNVHEIGESGGTLVDRPDFNVNYSEGCSGTIMPRTTVTCTITNTFTGTR